MNKHQQLRAIENKLKSTVDRLGKPIDPKIFPVVVALKAHGFHTTQSCQGHLGHGIAAPWVDISIPDAASLDTMLDQEENIR